MSDAQNNGADNKPVEYLIENTKVAHFNYSNFMAGSSQEVTIYVSKGMPDITGKPVFSIELSGYTQLMNNRTNIEGDIYEPEIDRVIRSLEFISDSLLTSRPLKKINYFLNLAQSYFSVEATYDPDAKRDGWKITLYLDRRNPDTYAVSVEPKDVDDLAKAFKMALEEIKLEQ
jgi:hypothetical protein